MDQRRADTVGGGRKTSNMSPKVDTAGLRAVAETWEDHAGQLEQDAGLVDFKDIAASKRALAASERDTARDLRAAAEELDQLREVFAADQNTIIRLIDQRAHMKSLLDRAPHSDGCSVNTWRNSQPNPHTCSCWKADTR